MTKIDRHRIFQHGKQTHWEETMDSVIAAEIARLQNMTVSSLAEKFESLISEKCRSRNKRYLIRRIAWRMQANAEGGLSERALKRAAELALDSEVRVTPPKHSKSSQTIIAASCSAPVLSHSAASRGRSRLAIVAVCISRSP
jgi:hypothetical protein